MRSPLRLLPLPALLLAFLACGGKTNGVQPPEDTGTPVVDTGVADTTPADTGAVDTGVADTGTAPSDADEGYDVPGSLFDADIPDVVFDNGTTAQGCVDCLRTNCQSQLATCDADERCRGLTLCVLDTCQGAGDTACIFGCADNFGVTGFSDPIIGEAQGILNCESKSCTAECPNVNAGGGDAGGAPDAAPSDGGSASDGGGAPGKRFFDPRVIEALASFSSGMSANPAARELCIETFSR